MKTDKKKIIETGFSLTQEEKDKLIDFQKRNHFPTTSSLIKFATFKFVEENSKG